MRRIGDARPQGAVSRALLGVLIAGLILRLVAIVGLWPATNTLDDGYQRYVRTSPFLDPQHPAGYGLILAAIGAVTRQVALPVLLQHLTAFGSALMLWAAVRRLTGSGWPGLVPAVFIMLNPDEIFLEHAIMAESWSVLAASAGFYAAVRAFDEPTPSWRWPLIAGAAMALAATIRSADLLLVPVAVVSLAACPRQPVKRSREYWLSTVVAAGAAAAILLVYATANDVYGKRFWLTPSPGWIAYGSASQFADCRRFTPPTGARVLCDARPPPQRPGSFYFMFDPGAPAPRHFGPFGEHDDLVGRWARRAARAQPADYLRMAWTYARSYYVPSSAPDRPAFGNGLHPQLSFAFTNPFLAPSVESSLEQYYGPFTVTRRRKGLRFLDAWQPVTSFGATALAISTLLTLIGLAVGTRRTRAGLLLFGLGGLALLLPAALTANYVGRYTVPMAGPMSAAAAIALLELWRRLPTRRSAGASAHEPRHAGATSEPRRRRRPTIRFRRRPLDSTSSAG